LAKPDWIEAIFKEEEDTQKVFLEYLNHQRKRLLDAKEKFGKSEILPEEFEAK